jgi:hypothetical protein
MSNENVKANFNFHSTTNKRKDSPVIINNFFIFDKKNSDKILEDLKLAIKEPESNILKRNDFTEEKLSKRWKRMKSIYKSILNFFNIPTKNIDEVQIF